MRAPSQVKLEQYTGGSRWPPSRWALSTNPRLDTLEAKEPFPQLCRAAGGGGGGESVRPREAEDMGRVASWGTAPKPCPPRRLAAGLVDALEPAVSVDFN